MRAYAAHIAATFVPLVRTPMFWAPVVIFPTLLYSFFGLPPALQAPDYADMLLASWSAFAVIGVSFFQFGISIAQSRESKWEDYARTLPVGAGPRLAGQAFSAFVFTSLALALMWTLALIMGATSLNVTQFARLFVVLLFGGAAPFVMLGAALGYLMPPRGAVPIANLIYLPLAYFGGLWMPPSMMPDFAARISPYTPTRHVGELAWASVSGAPLPAHSIGVMAAYAGAGALIALIMWRRDEAVRAR